MLSPFPSVSCAPRRLIVVAFHYPPDNSSTGVLRTAKFTQYLLEHGWNSEVITVPSGLYENVDPEAAQRVPNDIAVRRVWARDIKDLLGYRGIYPAVAAFPDRYWPWWFSATRRALQSMRQAPAHAIYSTYPVATAHLIGRTLKRKTGLPWIADFRDPWMDESLPPLRRKLEARLERSIIACADRVICNTPAMRRDFIRRYPDQTAGKFVTITNGYDEPDFGNLVPETIPKFQILYPGGLDAENRNPRCLLAGIRLALDKKLINPSDLQVTFLGCGPYADSPRFLEDVARYSLGQYLSVQKDRVPYRRALARMAGADAVVVLSENLAGSQAVQRWTALQVPAKVYEYLRLGRPLLALVSEGAVKELLESAAAGIVIAPENIDEIAAALGRLYAAKRAGHRTTLEAASCDVSRFSREFLTRLLAQELDSLTLHPSDVRSPTSLVEPSP